VRKLFTLFREFIVPMFKKWQRAGAEARKAIVLDDGITLPADMARLWESAKLHGMKVPGIVRWVYQVTQKPLTWKVRILDPAEPVPRCNDGIQCEALRATGKCALFHSPAEVSCARQELAEKAASCAALGKSSLGAPVLPSVAATTAVDPAVTNENPPLYGKACVMLSLKKDEFVVVGDSGATKATANLAPEYLHERSELPPSHQFQFEGIGNPVKITEIGRVYMKVRAVVFDTDAEVRERFESCEYLGADALYYYFAVSVYPNSHMPRNVLLLSLGSLCKQQGWRVVLDHAPGAASYALTPPQGPCAVRLTLQLRIGVKDPADADFDEDDSLVTLPDVTLLTHADLAQMPLFKKAEAEWDRAYERHQVMLANKAAQDEFHYEVPPEPAPLVFFVSKQEDTAHSLSEGAYKF
jgi:hypothetical protein